MSLENHKLPPAPPPVQKMGGGKKSKTYLKPNYRVTRSILLLFDMSLEKITKIQKNGGWIITPPPKKNGGEKVQNIFKT